MSHLQLFDPVSTRMNKLFHQLWRNDLPDLLRDEPSLDMKIDVAQDEANYIVRADMPGLNKADIKVDVDGNLVTITAERKAQKDEKQGETTVYSERYYGRTSRSFSLDCAVDESHAEATYKDGVLQLTLPKKGGGQSKRLTID